jgi:hypothetical protein
MPESVAIMIMTEQGSSKAHLLGDAGSLLLCPYSSAFSSINKAVIGSDKIQMIMC